MRHKLENCERPPFVGKIDTPDRTGAQPPKFDARAIPSQPSPNTPQGSARCHRNQQPELLDKGLIRVWEFRNQRS